MNIDMNVPTYCSGLNVIRQKFEAVTENVFESMTVVKLIAELPEKFNNFRQTYSF